MTIYGNNYWEIVKPKATTNLIQNPSGEIDTTGFFGASGGTIARTTASQFKGSYGVQVTPTSASSSGAYFGGTLQVAGVSGSVYTFSTFFKGTAGVNYQIYFATHTSCLVLGTPTEFAATGEWERQTVTRTENGNASRWFHVVKNGDANTDPFYIDGLQVENFSSATTYCDGDQDGCVWVADKHGSQSWRDEETRAGGDIINLNSDYDVIVQQQPGAGMPPVENISTNLGIQDGGLYQRTKTQVRSFSLDGVVSGSDTADFHFRRNRLVELFRSDGGAPQQPFLLRYTTGSSVTKQIKAHYDGGFEMNQVGAFIETFSARLIAYDPYWEEIKDNAQSLDVRDALSTVSVIKYHLNNLSNEGGYEAPNIGLEGVKLNSIDNKLYFVNQNSQFPKRFNFQSQAIEDFVPTTAGCGFTFLGGGGRQ